MRNRAQKILILSAFILGAVGAVAQPSEVVVRFNVDPESDFFLDYASIIPEIEQQADSAIAVILQEYLPFISFTCDTADSKLTLTLIEKPTSIFNTEFWVRMTFSAASGDTFEDHWKFLSSDEYNSLGESAAQVIDKLSDDWRDHVKNNYNQTFLKRVTENVVITLRDSGHFIVRDVDGTAFVYAALPMTKEQMKLDTQNCEFKVIIIGTAGSNQSQQAPPVELTYVRSVAPNEPQVEEDFMHCVLIGTVEKEEIPLTEYQSAHVQIKKYKRMLYPQLSSDLWSSGHFITLNCSR